MKDKVLYVVVPQEYRIAAHILDRPTIANDTSKAAQKTKANLDALFTASGAYVCLSFSSPYTERDYSGPEYVTCYESFESCVLAAVGNVTVSSKCTLGPGCATIPFQTAIIDTTSPYQAAKTAIDKAQKNGKSKEKVRVSAYQAAAAAAKQQVKALQVTKKKKTVSATCYLIDFR